MNRVTRHSPAKINVSLRVGARRTDGFHEIESLIVRVGLFDELTFTPRDDSGIEIVCDDASSPTDRRNLAAQAAAALRSAAGITQAGVTIHLRKRIPAGAGMGGGSSDAATTLVALNKMWNCGLNAHALESIAAEIGSDVPLFLHDSPCVVTGRGECVRDLATPIRGWVALLLSSVTCDTARVYAAFDRITAPARGAAAVWNEATSADALMERCFNDLEPAAFNAHPELDRIARAVAEATGVRVRMTGSGSGLFRLFDRREDADEFARRAASAASLRTEVAELLCD